MAFLRYQTVRNGLIGAALGGGVVALVLTSSGDTPVAPVAPLPVASTPTPETRAATAPPPTPTPPTTSPTTASTSTSTSTASAPASEPYAAQLATIAKVILTERATSDKVKDYFRGNGPKVNIYDDNKDGQWDRAKVDFDRDEVDDEKLTFKAGTIERKTEKTGLIRVWDNGVWHAK